MSPLNARQRICYKNTANLWEPTYPVNDGTKEQVDSVWVLRSSAVPCLLKSESSIEAPRGPFRIEVDNAFSRESWHFAADVSIDSDWIIQDVTVDRFGVNGPNYGRCWKCAGQPQAFPALGGRNANLKIVQANQEPNPPDEVTL